jgi:hypothetical protein
MSSLNSSRGILRTKCTKTIANVVQNIDSYTISDCKVKLETIEIYKSKLIELDEQILSSEIPEVSGKTPDQYCELEMECESYIHKLKSCAYDIKARMSCLELDNNYANPSFNYSGIKMEGHLGSKNKISLPSLQLPEFHADESRDLLTCSVFF